MRRYQKKQSVSRALLCSKAMSMLRYGQAHLKFTACAGTPGTGRVVGPRSMRSVRQQPRLAAWLLRSFGCCLARPPSAVECSSCSGGAGDAEGQIGGGMRWRRLEVRQVNVDVASDELGRLFWGRLAARLGVEH